jgi:hypothetical protein
MWLFTKHGFFSAVCARTGNGKPTAPVDPDRVMVRARVREHLEALRDRFPELLGDCPIVESTGTDYACRIFVPKATWSKVAAALAESVDYANFKAAVGDSLGDSLGDYQHALHEVWSTMWQLQQLRAE